MTGSVICGIRYKRELRSSLLKKKPKPKIRNFKFVAGKVRLSTGLWGTAQVIPSLEL